MIMGIEVMVAIIGAVLGSTGLFTFLQFLITRKDKKNTKKWDVILDEIGEIKKDIRESRKDDIKTQLLLLMSDYSDNVAEIFKLAEEYFVEYNGNTFVTPIFKEWLKKNNLKEPDWFVAHLRG